MAEKNFLNSRIINKHDSAENWAKATGFTPMAGELIVYDVDSTHTYERIKVGDGIRNVNDLPFIYDIITVADIDEICGATIEHANEVMF